MLIVIKNIVRFNQPLFSDDKSKLYLYYKNNQLLIQELCNNK